MQVDDRLVGKQNGRTQRYAPTVEGFRLVTIRARDRGGRWGG